jgi:hypothetical protein
MKDFNDNKRIEGHAFQWLWKLPKYSRSFLVMAVGVALLWQSLFFIIRLWSVLVRGSIYLTTGGEENPVYGIWRLVNGYPLYSAPDESPYVLHIYNFFFYYANAGFAWIFSANDGTLFCTGRLLSVLFTLIGFVASVGILRLLTPLKINRNGFLLATGLLAVNWFGYDNLGWLVMSVRPDCMALGFAFVGLLLYLKWDISGLRRWLFLAILMFSLSWGVKQSVIGAMGGCFLHGLLFGRNRFWMILFPLGPILVATVGYGLEGQNWLLNSFKAPGLTMNQTLGFPLTPLIRSTLTNLPAWIGSLLGILILKRMWSLYWDRKKSKADGALLIVICCALGTLMMSALALTRNGSTTNHLAEFYLVGSLLASSMITICFSESADYFYMRGGLLIALGLLFAQPLSLKNYFMGKTGTILGDSHDKLKLRVEFLEWYQNLPEPRLVVCSMLSSPWLAGHNGPDAYIIDPTYHPNRFRAGALKDGGYASLISQRKINTLLVGASDPLVVQALKEGYTIIPIPTQFQSLDVNWAGIDSIANYFGSTLDKMTVLVWNKSF